MFSLKDFAIVDLLNGDRRVSPRRPDPRGTASRAALRRVERQHLEEQPQRFRRDGADQRDLQEAAVVQERRGVGDARLGPVGGRSLHEERLRRHPDRKDAAARSLLRGVREAGDRLRDARVVRRVHRPVPRRREQRTRQMQHAPGQFRGKLGRLGHGLIIEPSRVGNLQFTMAL